MPILVYSNSRQYWGGRVFCTLLLTNHFPRIWNSPQHFFPASLQFYLHNHLSFILYFHKEKLEEGDVHNYRVVRFEVVPQSVKVDGRP